MLWILWRAMPRAAAARWQWLDASAYDSHGDLMRRISKKEAPPHDGPFMYQGMSDTFYSATADFPTPSEAAGIDFEGEFGVITDAVPMGVTAEQAAPHIRLIVLINDWSLRGFAPRESKIGFGWLQANRLAAWPRSQSRPMNWAQHGATAVSTCPCASTGTENGLARRRAIR